MINALVVVLLGLSVPGVILSARVLEGIVWLHSLVAFKLTLSPNWTDADVAGWLMSVNAGTHAAKWSLLPAPPVALELTGTAQRTEFHLLVPKGMVAAVQSGLLAGLPGGRLEEAPAYLKDRPQFAIAAEGKLSNHFRPLRGEHASTATKARLAAFLPLSGAEQIRVSWIITGGGIPRRVPSVSARSGERWGGGQAVPADPESVHAARLKQDEQLLRASVRVGIAGTSSKQRAYELFGVAWGPLRIINGTDAGIVRRWLLPTFMVARCMHWRRVPLGKRWPLTLNTEELAGLLGLVVADMQLPGLALSGCRPLPPPPDMPMDDVVFGVSDYQSLEGRPLAIRAADRLLHTHYLGPTGSGKSTELCNIALQLIGRGQAVVLIDPKNDLVDAITERFPETRDRYLIELDLTETDRPIGFNPLAVGADEHERELMVDHVLHVFYELWADFWGPRTDDVLRSALLTLVHARAADGSALTLCEVAPLLTNAAYRRALLSQAIPDQLREFWDWYGHLKPAEQATVIGPVLNKLRAFTHRTALRLLLGQSKGLDLSAVINNGGVLLVKLAKGRLGTPTATLAGSLLVTSLSHAIFGRANLPASERRQVAVFIDEAQDVVRVNSLSDLLAQARGYGAEFHLAHQYLHQLARETAHSLTGTVRNQVIFQVGQEDAGAVAKSIAPLTAADLQGLAAYHAVLRPCINGRTAAPVTMKTLPLPEPTRDGRALAHASRERWGVPRREVEAALHARQQVPAPAYNFGRSVREVQS